MISSEVYPNRSTAAGFQLVTTPSLVVPMIASPEPSTIAASRRAVASAALRSLMSIDEPMIATSSPAWSNTGVLVTRTVMRLPSRSVTS